MILPFMIEIETGSEMDVPYLKAYLAHKIGRVGIVKSVVYQPALTLPEKSFDTIDFDAWKDGQADL